MQLNDIINRVEKRLIVIFGILRGQLINLLYRNVKIGFGTYVEKDVTFDTLNGGKIKIGENCILCKGSIFNTEGGNITIGNNCSFNPYISIYGQGGVTIGNGVRIATQAVILPSNHNFLDKNKYIYEQGLSKKGILILDNVWIGANAVILDGVTIDFGSIIGASAVVTKNTNKFSINGGVPSKQIKEY